jgi:hypothetical protein
LGSVRRAANGARARQADEAGDVSEIGTLARNVAAAFAVNWPNGWRYQKM